MTRDHMTLALASNLNTAPKVHPAFPASAVRTLVEATYDGIANGLELCHSPASMAKRDSRKNCHLQKPSRLIISYI